MKDLLSGANVKVIDKNYKFIDPSLAWEEVRDIVLGDEQIEITNEDIEITIKGGVKKCRLLLSIMDWHELTGETENRQFHGTIYAILHPSVWGAIIGDVDNYDWEGVRDNGSAVLLTGQSEDYDQLLEFLKSSSVTIPIMIGFYLDQRQNAMGATGWETIMGDLMGEAFRSMIK